MPKILRNNIVALIILAVTLVVGITIGVVATTNAKKTMDFNVGVNYDPVFDIVVELTITKSGVTDTYKIFDSYEPSTINQTYISSITTDTINLKNLSDSTITAASLTIYNYTDKDLIATISETKYELDASTGKIENIDIKNGLLGATLVSLKFEEVPPPYEIIEVNEPSYSSALSGETYPYYVKYGTYGEYNVNWIVLGGNIAYDASSSYSLKSNGSYDEHLTTSSVTGVSLSKVQFTKATQWKSGDTTNGQWKYEPEDGKFYIYEDSWKPVVKLLLISEYAMYLNNTTAVYFDKLNTYSNNFFDNSDTSTDASQHVQLALASMQTDILGTDAKKWMSKTDIAVTHYHVSGKLGAYSHEQYEGFFLLGDNAWQYPSNHSYNGAGEESFGLHTYFGDDGASNNKAYRLDSPETATYWWLRSGYCDGSSHAMNINGLVNIYYRSVNDFNSALRPAFVLNLAA